MAVKPVVICLSRSGEATARRIATALKASLHGREGRVANADAYFANALDHIRDLFASATPIVGVCAAGILIRAVAPLLADKRNEPPLIAIPEDGSSVIPLLGGHHGANILAREIALALGVKPSITTAGDVALGLALDEPPAGWRLANPDDVKDAMATLLAGGGAEVDGDEAAKAEWLAKLPSGDALRITATMEPMSDLSGTHLAFHPLRATLGVGCSRKCAPDELAALVAAMLSEAELAPQAIAAIGSIDLKADEPAVLDLARNLNLPLRFFSAAELEAETPRLQNPSETVFAETGCHGVAEGAALALGGPSAILWYAKAKSANATCALAISPVPITELRGKPRGHLSIIGIGPGQSSWRTPEASKLIANADELVGYSLYIDLLGPLAATKTRADFPLGGEEDRCRYALEQAGLGRNIALICSGDAGIYAMGALVWELLDRDPAKGGVSAAARRVEVISTPGISAMQAAAARAGAPLGHDFCAISLSDLLTPRDQILRRLKAAAEGDFVIAFYNPVSAKRRTLLDEARAILLQHRPANTPVLLASSLGRPEESTRFRTLETLQTDEVDMLTLVIVGSSQSKLTQTGDGPRMFTPRGYARKIDGDLA